MTRKCTKTFGEQGTFFSLPMAGSALGPVLSMGIHVQAGGGIVADSVPELEYEETLNKARGLLRAIQVAEQIFGDKTNKRKSEQ